MLLAAANTLSKHLTHPAMETQPWAISELHWKSAIFRGVLNRATLEHGVLCNISFFYHNLEKIYIFNHISNHTKERIAEAAGIFSEAYS